jgi:hypothetical protein
MGGQNLRLAAAAAVGQNRDYIRHQESGDNHDLDIQLFHVFSFCI